MNILFVQRYLAPYMGGVERVSFLLQGELTRLGHNCFFAYEFGENRTYKRPTLKYSSTDNLKAFSQAFIEFIEDNKINVIINQDLYSPNLLYLYNLINKKGLCKIINCLHRNPCAYKYAASNRPTKLERLKILLWYLLFFHELNIKHDLYPYYKILKECDKFVLLSNHYINEFLQEFKLKSSEKLCAIWNPPTFADIAAIPYEKKKNQVVIVSRFEEFSKNLSSALRIWKKIESHSSQQWNLVIAGYGDDEQMIKGYAEKLGLKRIQFIGPVNEPQQLYLESSLFMLTSNFEGWSMTLVEAMSCACVPLVFNSYSALLDIVENEKNGFLITPKNEDDFASKMLLLMKKAELRLQMQKEASKIQNKFQLSKIGQEWNNLLNSVCNS